MTDLKLISAKRSSSRFGERSRLNNLLRLILLVVACRILDFKHDNLSALERHDKMEVFTDQAEIGK